MSRKTKSDAPEHDSGSFSGPRVSPGSFDPEGSWKSWMTHPSPTEHFVRLLIRARLAAHVTPAELADQIRGSAYAAAFPSANLRDWDQHRAWEDWPLAQTRTSAEEAVKRCGRGSEGYWRGGEWLQGHAPASAVAAPPDLATEQRETLALLGFDFDFRGEL